MAASKSFKIPLFWKFAIGLAMIVVLFGSINIGLVHSVIYASLEDELEQRGLSISRMISQHATELVLYEDYVALNKLVEEIKDADKSVEYIFILNRDQKVIAHTFTSGFPLELLEINKTELSNQIITEHLSPKGSKLIIRDISIPLLDGKVGTVRVGLTEENISKILKYAIRIMIIMVLGFFVLGMVGVFIVSSMVTHPVKSISRIAEAINLTSIKEKRVSFADRYPTAIERTFGIIPSDELDSLVAKFNEMVFRLEQAYEELEHAQKKLVQSEKLASIGTLASGIAHEVNNPLAGILHCIERLKKRPDDIQNNQKLLDLMEDAARKVDTVVNGLLNFARQSDNKFEYIQITDLFSNSLMLASHKLEKARISVTEVHKNANTLIFGNKNQIEQVVLNILLNSIDAINEKKEGDSSFQGKISLLSEQNNNMLVLTIKDNGCGILSDNMSKVFDPFYTNKTVGKGTGLGLSISLNIMKEHGGELIINSVENEGTEVLLTIPIANK
jgi:two-component system, NtrC family, sensor kinase